MNGPSNVGLLAAVIITFVPIHADAASPVGNPDPVIGASPSDLREGSGLVEAEPESDAETAIDGIVADPVPDENGIMQPSTGAAKPTENWFGCKPGSDGTACDRAGSE